MTDEVQRGLDYNLWPRPVQPSIEELTKAEGTPDDATMDIPLKESYLKTLHFNMIDHLKEYVLPSLQKTNFVLMLQTLQTNSELFYNEFNKASYEAFCDTTSWGRVLDALVRIEYFFHRNEALRVFRCTLTKKVPASFSLKELISLLKSLHSGWGPPLEMAARMLNSKFWVMEADVWADLLIVCCWANPTIYCEKCGNNVKLTTTSCNHVVCPVCAVGQGNDPSCPECGEIFTVLVFTSALASTQKKPITGKRPLCEPPTTATKRPCTDSGKSMVTRSRSKTAKPKHRRKPVSTIPLTTPDVQRPTPPALTGSCSQESRSKSFTTNNLSELLEYLYPPAVNKWYYLGLALGLHVDILEAIATKQRDKNLDCLKDMLITRLNKEKLSKEELIQSLQKPTVGLSELAQTLKDSKQW